MALITKQHLSLYSANQCYITLDNYLTRWKCEETYRYVKQAYNLEDVSVRKIVAIKNTVALVMAIGYFAKIYIGTSRKLKIIKKKIFVLAKRFLQHQRSFANQWLLEFTSHLNHTMLLSTKNQTSRWVPNIF